MDFTGMKGIQGMISDFNLLHPCLISCWIRAIRDIRGENFRRGNYVSRLI